MFFLSIAILFLFLSYVYDIGSYKKNKEFWKNGALLILIFFAGLKYHLGGDNYSYLYYFYDLYPDIDSITWDDFTIGKDPLFVLLNACVKALGGKFYIVQFIHAAIVNILIVNYFKRHSQYLFTCIFFYFITCYLHYNAEILRGSLSIVICLYGNDFIREKKLIKGFLLYGVALLFHAQTLLLFLLPLLFGMKLDKKGYIVLGLAFVFSYSLKDFLNSYLFVLDNMENVQNRTEMYLESEMYGSGSTSLAGLVVYLMPILYIIAIKPYLDRINCTGIISSIEPFIFLGLLFSVFNYNMPIFYRYVDYYRVYFVLLYAELFVKVSSNGINVALSNRLLKSVLTFIPFFFILTVSMTDRSSYIRYFPYTNIITKEIVVERERFFNDVGVKASDY